MAVLASGGLDSSILLAELARRGGGIHPIFIRQGLRWEASELFWLRRFLGALPFRNVRPLVILDVPLADLYRDHWSITGRRVPDYHSDDREVYLPGRNIILVSKAAVYCALHRVEAIALGPLKGNPFADASRRFFNAFSRAVSLGLEHPVRILTPFSRITKSRVLRRGRSLPLELTFSCIRPRGHRPCGSCNKCAERIRAFKKAGFPDPALTRRDRPPARPRRSLPR